MSATPQAPSNSQNAGANLTPIDTSFDPLTREGQLSAEEPALPSTRSSVDASEPANPHAEHEVVQTSSDADGSSEFPGNSLIAPAPLSIPLQTTLTTVGSATSLLSRPPSRDGNSSADDYVGSEPSSFELLRRRTIAQQPYRGMVRFTK